MVRLLMLQFRLSHVSTVLCFSSLRMEQDRQHPDGGRAKKFTFKYVLSPHQVHLRAAESVYPQQNYWWEPLESTGLCCKVVWKVKWFTCCLWTWKTLSQWCSGAFSVSFHPSDFLLFELQAARMIQQKESFPDEMRADDQSEKEQRGEDYSRELLKQNTGGEKREAELQAEWILLLHALDMDPSSQFSDLLDEVSLTCILLYHNFKSISLTGHLTCFLMQVKTRLAQLPGREMTDPLLNTGLSTDQWVGCQSCAPLHILLHL